MSYDTLTTDDRFVLDREKPQAIADHRGRRLVLNLSEVSRNSQGNRASRRKNARLDRRQTPEAKKVQSAFGRFLKAMKAKTRIFAEK